MECHGPVDLLLTCSALAAFMLPFLIAVLRITVEPDNSKANTAQTQPLMDVLGSIFVTKCGSAVRCAWIWIWILI